MKLYIIGDGDNTISTLKIEYQGKENIISERKSYIPAKLRYPDSTGYVEIEDSYICKALGVQDLSPLMVDGIHSNKTDLYLKFLDFLDRYFRGTPKM